MAFEHRIAACIADPGVVDVSRAWYASMPPQAVALINGGQQAVFDRIILSAPPKQLAAYRFRARPFGLSSPFEVFTAVKKYTLAGLFDKIAAPILIANPDNEQFFPGQPLELYNALSDPMKSLVPFMVAEGADGHCEPAAPGLRSQKAFDWLDATLAMR